jgi:formate hydrogenlyase subunit 6/NADH:ubiquinone oxidoreductase subunit I
LQQGQSAVNVLRQGVRNGIVTTSYPNQPEPAPPGYRGQILLRVDLCIGDGSCARVCPSDAITVTTTTPPSHWTWELDDARCVFCGLCAEVCPTSAILISNEFELSARQRLDLVIRANSGTLLETDPHEGAS